MVLLAICTMRMASLAWPAVHLAGDTITSYGVCGRLGKAILDGYGSEACGMVDYSEHSSEGGPRIRLGLDGNSIPTFLHREIHKRLGSSDAGDSSYLCPQEYTESLGRVQDRPSE